MTLISFEDVSYQFRDTGVKALSNVSVSVEKGEHVAIVGSNGSGKSTFGRLVNGLLIPTSGDVNVSGYTTGVPEQLGAVRQSVGMVFQNPDNQFVATTVEDDIAFGLENRQLSRDEMILRVTRYSQFLGIEDLLKREPEQLSGGQKQRVALAGVLALEPEAIVLDEATSMLDPVGREEVLDVLQLLKKSGITLLSITHDMNEVLMADRVLGFKEGELLCDQTPFSLFDGAELVAKLQIEPPFVWQAREDLRTCGLHVPACKTEKELLEALWTSHSSK
ncbi:energy-coupling factor transporter ATPase [Shouchella shacheensis]|uniref:energy-coupling factor transporter ATPase n=1 Tax=Shouchella shacheensis TaxID=1649580 RepID=UPI0007403276|nr:energy-coupling factor transporter ATPase [Shouchella shacheensis]